MNTKHTAHVGWQAVLVALCSCLLPGPLFAQQKDCQEAHVYITAPGAPPTTAPVSPAVEVIRPMLLSDHGFQTVEPLEQPDEHVPTIIIDEKKTFQTIIGFGADQDRGMMEVGAGEAIFNKHLENYFRLTGLVRNEPGPSGFKRGAKWIVTPVPEEAAP